MHGSVIGFVDLRDDVLANRVVSAVTSKQPLPDD
jgi:hypothetical protein